MADADFDDFDGGYGPSGTTARLAAQRLHRGMNLAGAVTSVVLLVGLGLWGYKLAVRDVTGVPVVRAITGPMRIAPENPGGTIADHQGLAVNEIAAVGIAAPPADRLVLAPRPVELSLEDEAGLVSAASADAAAPADANIQPDAALPDDLRLATPDVPMLPDVAETADNSATDNAVELALAEALADSPAFAPEPEDLAALDAGAVTDTGAVTAIEPAPEGAITRSPRPLPRPGSAVLAAPTTAAAPLSPEIDPATLEPGTRLIQLGAFDSADLARAEWARLQAKFGALLTGKSLVVQAAVSGGSTFYRLRAHGFAGEDDARRLCASLMPDHDNCIPVTHR